MGALPTASRTTRASRSPHRVTQLARTATLQKQGFREHLHLQKGVLQHCPILTTYLQLSCCYPLTIMYNRGAIFNYRDHRVNMYGYFAPYCTQTNLVMVSYSTTLFYIPAVLFIMRLLSRLTIRMLIHIAPKQV
ncbi:hypothetical protein EV363DRAFT_1195388 [Boletus edulis]|nr:hypothetical protein EV363DRAFT_1195388 [Boletus edulis]